MSHYAIGQTAYHLGHPVTVVKFFRPTPATWESCVGYHKATPDARGWLIDAWRTQEPRVLVEDKMPRWITDYGRATTRNVYVCDVSDLSPTPLIGGKK